MDFLSKNIWIDSVSIFPFLFDFPRHAWRNKYEGGAVTHI